MSTNINITVGDNALLDRAKQQQTANRQAQLNRENSTRLEAQATDERTKAQAASGKDFNGNPLYGVPTPTPQIDRRPAANRQQTFDYGQGYFTVSRSSAPQAANITVRSGDKSAVTTFELAGSEWPEGFRDRTGIDSLPFLPEPPDGAYVFDSQQYYKRYGITTDEVFDGAGNLLTFTVTYYGKRHVGARYLFDDPSSGTVVQTAASATGSGGWVDFRNDRYSSLVILPINNTTAVFAYTETILSYKSYFYEQFSYVENRSNVPGAPFCTPGSVEYSCTPGITVNLSNTTKYAVLVGKNFVKQIPYPTELYEALDSSAFYRPASYEPELASGTKYFFPCGLNEYSVPVTYLGYNFTNITLPPPDNLGRTQSDMVAWGEALQYRLYNRSSPGVYSALSAGIVVPASPWKYADIKSLLPPAGQNFKWFRVDENTDPDQLQRYKGELPEYYGDPFDETTFTRVKSVTYEQQPGETYYRWNDWENSAYCRQQATALGFTSADLTP